MNVEFNKKGNPLLIEFSSPSGSALATTIGVPTHQTKADIETTPVKNYDVINWGDDNDYPQKADKIISQTDVLNTGLKFLRNLTLGQGIYACKVAGFDENGNEKLKAVQDPGINRLIRSRMVRRHLEKLLRDYLKYGVGFAQLVPSVTGNSFAGIYTTNALYTRITKNKSGFSHCLVSGKFPETPDELKEDYFLLDDNNPELSIEQLKKDGKLKDHSVVFAVKDSWSNNDHYSCPIWWSAQQAGWIDIAHNVPRFLLKAYENQVTLKWHIQIPYAFWEKQFPYADFPDGSEERKKAISDYLVQIENNLCGKENAEKPLITMYAMNEANGRAEEEWKIVALDNKIKDADRLVTSAAANSEILFSLMINPNVMGAGMPGGAYAGNQGGSNIREAFLVNIANAWLDRQNILDPLELYLQNNGFEDIELRFRNTILTTLDTGAGTKKVLS